MRGKSKEETVATQIGRYLSDFSLDLEAVGYYMAMALPYPVYRRAVEVLEATEYNKEITEYNKQGRSYRDNIQK